MNLKEFIEDFVYDVDVCTDYADTFIGEDGREHDAYIAFCPGDKLSAEGQKKWAGIMNLEVLVCCGGAVVHIPKADDSIMEKMQTDVMMLFYTFAGCVGESFYDKMIEEEYYV